MKSVSKQSAFAVATYSCLLLIAVNLYQDQLVPQLAPLWRKDATRPSIRMLIKQLKRELLNDSSIIHELQLTSEAIEMILKIAA